MFEDYICVRQYGPVVPKVYREYRIYVGMPILRSEKLGEMGKEITNFLIRFG